jgi:hypothetical protein
MKYATIVVRMNFLSYLPRQIPSCATAVELL